MQKVKRHNGRLSDYRSETSHVSKTRIVFPKSSEQNISRYHECFRERSSKRARKHVNDESHIRQWDKRFADTFGHSVDFMHFDYDRCRRDDTILEIQNKSHNQIIMKICKRWCYINIIFIMTLISGSDDILTLCLSWWKLLEIPCYLQINCTLTISQYDSDGEKISIKRSIGISQMMFSCHEDEWFQIRALYTLRVWQIQYIFYDHIQWISFLLSIVSIPFIPSSHKMFFTIFINLYQRIRQNSDQLNGFQSSDQSSFRNYITT